MKVEGTKTADHVDIKHMVIRDGAFEIHAQDVTYYEDTGIVEIRWHSTDDQPLAVIKRGRLMATLPNGYKYNNAATDELVERVKGMAKELNGVSLSVKYPMQGGPT